MRRQPGRGPTEAQTYGIPEASLVDGKLEPARSTGTITVMHDTNKHFSEIRRACNMCVCVCVFSPSDIFYLFLSFFFLSFFLSARTRDSFSGGGGGVVCYK